MTHPNDMFVDRMGQTAEADGLSPIAARLFALLLVSDEPRSLDDLAVALGVSKASVCTEARRLFERHVVERVTHPGDRRDYYELAPDFFAQIVRARVAQWRRVQELAASLRGSTRATSVVRDRLASIDELQTGVIDKLDADLAAWEARARKRALKRAAVTKPAGAAPRRRHSA